MLNFKRIAQVGCLLLPLSISTLVFANKSTQDISSSANGVSTASTSMRGDNMEKRLQKLTKKLNLTTEQQQQISQRLNSTKPDMQRYMSQMKAAHQELEQMMTKGNFNNRDIQKIALQAGEATSHMIMLRAQSTKAIYDALTPDQKTQFLTILQEKSSKMQQHSNQERHVPDHDRMQSTLTIED
jgi:Spy/CpxP family protein refolding chaperone